VPGPVDGSSTVPGPVDGTPRRRERTDLPRRAV